MHATLKGRISLRPGTEFSAPGFSLLELIVTLVLIALIFSFGFIAMKGGDSEAELREPMLAVEGLAKRARSVSMMQRRPYELYFNAEGVTLAPAGGMVEEVESEPLFFDEEDGVPPVSFDAVQDNFTWPEGVEMQVRGWNGDWITLEKKAEFVWFFEPDELVEPVQVRAETEDGWLMQEYNPLTAAMSLEDYDIR